MSSSTKILPSSYRELLDYLQKIMELDDRQALKTLMNSCADCTLLGFRKISKVHKCYKLTVEEKDYLINLLTSGKQKVWILVDVVPWAH